MSVAVLSSQQDQASACARVMCLHIYMCIETVFRFHFAAMTPSPFIEANNYNFVESIINDY